MWEPLVALLAVVTMWKPLVALIAVVSIWEPLMALIAFVPMYLSTFLSRPPPPSDCSDYP
jgi:hypothetical protein